MILKTLLRNGTPGRSTASKTNYCTKETKGKVCGVRTREGKEFCGSHIEELPYVQQLLQRIETKEKEVEQVRKKGKKGVDSSSENLKEIKTHLEFNGSRTKKRLARELQLTSSGMEGFLDYMEDEEEITRSRTSRGDETIHLS